jgi:predicted DNA repair protein MutK
MPGSSLLTLIDDIATVLDDVAVLTKVAAKKTAGVLGDDLALNAQQVTGVRPDRELPVVWAVAKGSAINKVILVPIALLISALAPWAVVPLLMLGGSFLCFEGFEKISHKLFHGAAEEQVHRAELVAAVADESVDLVAFEREKIKGAVRTDFILSAEIIVISLGSVAGASFGIRVAVLCGISVLMTVGVYGLVAGIVKLDDLGLHLSSRRGPLRPIGRAILWFAPYLMKSLSIAGTAAMFVVGGGIVAHGIAPLQRGIDAVTAYLSAQPGYGGVLGAVAPSLMNGVVGLLLGAVLVLLFTLGKKLLPGKKAAA